MRFQEIQAHHSAIEKLKFAVRNHHVSHAQHFLGTESSGNLPVALAFATLIFCENPLNEDSCGQCASCVKMAKFTHPDLHFLFPIVNPSKNKSVGLFLDQWRMLLKENPYIGLNEWMEVIADENKMPIISVDLADELQKNLSLKAFEGGYKIAIIWLPELMPPASANKLLKLLEEPPEKTIFLLVGNETESLLQTILSRVQTIVIPKLSISEMQHKLVSTHQLSEDDAHEIALVVEGNYSEALTLISGDSGQQRYFDLFADWMRTCYKKSESGKLVPLSEIFSNLKREGQKSFLVYALQMMRQCALFSAGAGELIQVTDKKRTFAENFGKQFPVERFTQMTGLLDKAAYHIERNASAKILFMSLSVELKNLMHN